MKNGIKYLLFAISLFIMSKSRAQLQFGVGMGLGQRSALCQGGISAEVKYKNTFDIFGFAASEKYSAGGYGFGVNLIILPSKKWSPTLLFTQMYVSERIFYFENSNGDPLNHYRIDPYRNRAYGIGMRCQWKSKEGQRPKQDIHLEFHFSYRHPIENNEIELIEGDHDINTENKINKTIGPGFGAGIKLTYFFSSLTGTRAD